MQTLYKIIVSNKLLGLLRLGLGLGFGSGFILYARHYNPNKLLELLNVVTNNFIRLQRSNQLARFLKEYVLVNLKKTKKKELLCFLISSRYFLRIFLNGHGSNYHDQNSLGALRLETALHLIHYRNEYTYMLPWLPKVEHH